MRIGILGAARIAPRALIEPAAQIEGVEAFAVAARDRKKADAFASEHGLPRVFDSYADLCESDEVDAVYNALPISAHCEWTLRAVACGKPVLCEKAFSSNAAEAERMARAAHEAGVVLVEAFHWRYHPMAEEMMEIVQSGRLGRIREIRSHFNVAITDPENIRLNFSTGGGATMDLGCYPVHMLRHVVGEEPDVVSARAEVGPPEVDLSMQADMRFPSGAQGQISCSMKQGEKFSMELVAEGESGRMHALNPVAPQMGNQLTVETEASTDSSTVDGESTYFHQLEAFLAAVRDGTPVPTDSQDAVLNMRVLDNIYERAGLRLRGEV